MSMDSQILDSLKFQSEDSTRNLPQMSSSCSSKTLSCDVSLPIAEKPKILESAVPLSKHDTLLPICDSNHHDEKKSPTFSSSGENIVQLRQKDNSVELKKVVANNKSEEQQEFSCYVERKRCVTEPAQGSNMQLPLVDNNRTSMVSEYGTPRTTVNPLLSIGGEKCALITDIMCIIKKLLILNVLLRT